MTFPWVSARNLDADIAPCQRCAKDVVLDHDAPCPHGYVACPECGHPAGCRDCRRNEELETWAANIGTPHDLDRPTSTLREVLAEQAADTVRYQADTGFDSTTNAHRSAS